MKNDLRPWGIASALGLFLVLALGSPAQEKPVPAEAGSLAATSVDATATPPPPADVSAAPVAPTSPAGAISVGDAAPPDSIPVDASAPDTPAPAMPPAAPQAAPAPTPPAAPRRVDQPFPRGGQSRDPVVAVFNDATLVAGEAADAVVSVFGSSTSAGDVGNAVVSVFGNSRMTGGRVRDSVVSVFGNTYVNGEVRGQVVAVLGSVELGPDARVGGQIVCIAGKVTRDPHAVVGGHVQRVNLGVGFDGAEWVQAWVTRCLFYARPLAIGPHLAWLWWITLGLLAFYVLLAGVFRGGVEACAQTLETRPGFSLLAAVLATLFVPVLIVLLIVTGVGIVFVPFVIAALFFASIFGRVVILAWLGRRVAPLLGGGLLARPAGATLVGGVIVMGLYLIPVVGFLVYKLIGVLGLGVVVYTLIRGAKRKSSPLPPVASMPPPPAPAPHPTTMAFAAEEPAAPAEATTLTGDASAREIPPPVLPSLTAAAVPPPPPAVPQRAGFWIRLAASLIDALLVAIAVHLLPDRWQPDFPLVYAIYCIGLWALKSTTIGGIVCGLKVVRLDGRPVDGATALVRALGGFLSLIAVGLGFIWVAFDDRRQSWHDKIAGTTIVLAPKGVSLV